RRLALHHLDRFLCAQKHTGKVRRDDILPGVEWQIFKRHRRRANTGIVKQHIKPPKGRFYGCEQRNNRLPFGYVSWHDQGLRPRPTLISPATLSSITLRRPASTRL